MDDVGVIRRWVERKPGKSRNLKTDGLYLSTATGVTIGVHVMARETTPLLGRPIAPLEPMRFLRKPDGLEGAVALKQYGAAWRAIGKLGVAVKEIDTPLPTPDI